MALKEGKEDQQCAIKIYKDTIETQSEECKTNGFYKEVEILQ